MKRKHFSRSRVAVATAVALAAGIAGLPGVATADEAPAAPRIAVGRATVDLYGPAAELDVTLTAPPSADAYVALDSPGGLHFTDDAGNVLPVVKVPGHVDRVLVGADDSDHNGVPGAPLTAGVIHLHVSAAYPAQNAVYGFVGYIVDGSTGEPVVSAAGTDRGGVTVNAPKFRATWLGVSGSESDTDVSVVAGERRATMVDVATTDTGTLPPVTQTRLTITAASIAQSGYTPQLLASMLHLGYSTDSSTYTAQRWTVTADGSLTMGFPARRWAPPGGTFSESLKLTADWGLPSGEVMVDLQSFGADGKLYAGSLASVFVGAFQVPAYLRGVVFGRDSNGELWRYEATPDPDRPGRFAPPVLVGQGWNAYSALTPLGLLKADNTGGGLVARDRSGVLWFYRSNGAAGGSFAPRTRVGTGWNTYNSLVGAGDVTGDGHADLLGRDSAGVLWLYRGTGSATAPLVSSRVRVGGGWLGYKSLIGAGDVTGDGRGDLLAVDAAGKMWLYASTGNSAAPYRSRVQVGTGWQIYNRIVGVADMTGDGHPDLLARDPAGRLWYYRGTGNPVAPYAGRVQSDTGWSGYDVVF